ncbi:MAG: NADH-quinone oxidoreductase subunit J [Gemmatimonadales bacterium]
MKTTLATDLVFWALAVGSVLAGWRVFRTDSMLRAAYWLLASFVGVAGILVLLGAEFLGLVLILMMAGEMTIMAVFMIMFMMNPAGLNPMMMVHQHRAAIVAGVVAFLGLAGVGLFGHFPAVPAATAASGGATVTADLGRELLGNSMLVFETAGVALLATMIGALAIAGLRGRYGDASGGSVEPAMEPGAEPPDRSADPPAEEMAHEGHGGMHE